MKLAGLSALDRYDCKKQLSRVKEHFWPSVSCSCVEKRQSSQPQNIHQDVKRLATTFSYISRRKQGKPPPPPRGMTKSRETAHFQPLVKARVSTYRRAIPTYAR